MIDPFDKNDAWNERQRPPPDFARLLFDYAWVSLSNSKVDFNPINVPKLDQFRLLIYVFCILLRSQKSRDALKIPCRESKRRRLTARQPTNHKYVYIVYTYASCIRRAGFTCSGARAPCCIYACNWRRVVYGCPFACRPWQIPCYANISRERECVCVCAFHSCWPRRRRRRRRYSVSLVIHVTSDKFAHAIQSDRLPVTFRRVHLIATNMEMSCRTCTALARSAVGDLFQYFVPFAVARVHSTSQTTQSEELFHWKANKKKWNKIMNVSTTSAHIVTFVEVGEIMAAQWEWMGMKNKWRAFFSLSFTFYVFDQIKNSSKFTHTICMYLCILGYVICGNVECVCIWRNEMDVTCMAG